MPDLGYKYTTKMKQNRESKTTVLCLRRAALEWRENHKTSLITPPTCDHGALFS